MGYCVGGWDGDGDDRCCRVDRVYGEVHMKFLMFVVVANYSMDD